jgi:hypothetical protein
MIRGREKYTPRVLITFLTSLMWAIFRENRGESSNSLKNLTYFERVVIISSFPFFYFPSRFVVRI